MSKFLNTVLILLFFSSFIYAQTYIEEIKSYQEELNTEYKDKDESPLSRKDRLKFKAHTFFNIDETYKVEAEFERINDAIPFKMETSSTSKPTYEKYGKITFTLKGKEYQLYVYQSHRLRKMEQYKDYLFLPFTDKTNSKTTYGAGRYIEISIPEGNTMIIDFNKAYNPYCAYAEGYACPIPPPENYLDTEVEAGIMYKTK
ncbi:DUF1684 domain-containing protein [Flammeovirga pectinis]|uniref:DUF1684 domain-containing protein n=1 Tax=Flammeovirga pectinis TaxID=2494373 RepID=A0A3S9PAS2_9BACT|nr:DUF1684 domain-containing protein [Flammeovirga pectinis]AZQ65306.1 DUF1684 domain-containing protein [Flammeovirga pectinis]